jgi:ribosomal protein S18 acetylase RimI-like enzyme
VDALQAREAVAIRPIAAQEVPAIERDLPRYPGKHRERLAAQATGECLYLIAWAGQHAIGHLNLRLTGRKLPDRARDARAAHVEDLRVAPAHRRRGVGTKLMQRAQFEAEKRGFDAIGLGVDVTNRPARDLYTREGYEESGRGRFVVTYPYIDERGRERQARETCTYLIKGLRRGADSAAQ